MSHMFGRFVGVKVGVANFWAVCGAIEWAWHIRVTNLRCIFLFSMKIVGATGLGGLWGDRVGVAYSRNKLALHLGGLWALEWAWQSRFVGVRVGVAVYLWALEWAWHSTEWALEWAWHAAETNLRCAGFSGICMSNPNIVALIDSPEN